MNRYWRVCRTERSPSKACRWAAFAASLGVCAAPSYARAQPAEAPPTEEPADAPRTEEPADAPPTEGQPTEPASPETVPDPATPPSTPTADDLAEIEAALAADARVEKPADSEAPGEGAVPTRSRAGVQSLNPDISVILDVAGAWFSEDENLQSGGHDPTETGFNLQQLEIAVGASIDPYFRFDSNLVFALTGVEIEEAYGTTLAFPARLQMRFGQMLTRFGRINPTHPHTWDFVDQPFALGRVFGPEGNRGLGVELSWLSPLPWYVELVGSVTRADGGATARSFFGNDNPGVDDPLDFQLTGALKQFYPLGEDWSLFWGLSTANGPNATGRGNRTDVFGTDLYVKYRPITRESSTMVSLQTEWFLRRRQVPDDVLTDLSGYAQLAWRFARRWGTAARWELGTPEAADGVGETFRLDPTWSESRQRISANVTLWPTEFSRFRLQGSADLPEWLDRPVFAAFLAAELVAGAHGSHDF